MCSKWDSLPSIFWHVWKKKEPSPPPSLPPRIIQPSNDKPKCPFVQICSSPWMTHTVTWVQSLAVMSEWVVRPSHSVLLLMLIGSLFGERMQDLAVSKMLSHHSMMGMKVLEGGTGVMNGIWVGGWKTQVTTPKYRTFSANDGWNTAFLVSLGVNTACDMYGQQGQMSGCWLDWSRVDAAAKLPWHGALIFV